MSEKGVSDVINELNSSGVFIELTNNNVSELYNAGSYSIHLKITGSSNYNNFDSDINFEINPYTLYYNVYASNYYVSSKKLYAEYMKIDSFKKPKAIVHDICDGTRFIPINLDRFKDEEKSLTIRLGW